MAIYRSMTAQRVQQFAATLADGRSVAHLANGRRQDIARKASLYNHATVEGSVVQAAIAALSPVEVVKAELAKLSERVTDQQVSARQDWMRAACDYAQNYAGTFSYMLDMRQAMKRYNGLSVPQMRGTLNCLRAEGQREIQQAQAAAPTAPQIDGERQGATVVLLKEILDGFYTVKFDDGTHTTIRINTVKTPGKNRGVRFASYLCGPINTSDYRRFATVKGNSYRGFYGFKKQTTALEILMGADDATEYGRAYAKLATRCYRCGKLLTEPESIDTGIGPICAGRE